jgi:hypothetical protein
MRYSVLPELKVTCGAALVTAPWQVSLTTMLGSGLSGVYRAPNGMTALVASMRLFGQTFQDSLMPSVSSSSMKASDMVPADRADRCADTRCYDTPPQRPEVSKATLQQRLCNQSVCEGLHAVATRRTPCDSDIVEQNICLTVAMPNLAAAALAASLHVD